MKRLSGILISSVFMLGTAAHVAATTQQDRHAREQVNQEADFLSFAGTENIRESERVLRAQGYNPGPIDGVVDEQTRQALRDFQQVNGLPVSGVLDWQTSEELIDKGARYKGSLSVVQNLSEWNEYLE